VKDHLAFKIAVRLAGSPNVVINLSQEVFAEEYPVPLSEYYEARIHFV
jgi:hypothetical protein